MLWKQRLSLVCRAKTPLRWDRHYKIIRTRTFCMFYKGWTAVFVDDELEVKSLGTSTSHATRATMQLANQTES